MGNTHNKHQRDRYDRFVAKEEGKPRNNRVFCPGCGRPKQLFESEDKALRFIRFNGDNIDKGDQLRAYHCACCGGWHITSHEYNERYTELMDKMTEARTEQGRKIKAKDESVILWRLLPADAKLSTRKEFVSKCRELMASKGYDEGTYNKILECLVREYKDYRFNLGR